MRNPFRRDPDPFAATRYSGLIKSVRMREHEHMRHWWQWAALVVSLLVALAAGIGTWLYYRTQNRVQDEIGGVDRESEGKPFNALLVGSDSRAGLTAQEQLDLGAGAIGGERADTLILAHVDPATDRVITIQFPRDLYVPIAGSAPNKINSALAGGPETVVRTVKDLTGLSIHHYVQVNIDGFRDAVNAIDGVDVCITEPIPFDPNTGIEITPDEVGLVHFSGEEALRFVRSRRFTTGDFERIANQQKFLSAAIDKVTSSSTLFNPTRIFRIASALGDSLTVDQHTTLLGLRELAGRLRSFTPDRYEAYVAPNLGITSNEAGSVVIPDMDAMKVMFDALGRNESPAEADGVPNIAPSTIRVGMYNGTFEDLAAAEAGERLESATDIGDGAVRIVDTANADRFGYKRTVIVREPEAAGMAELVAAAIPGAEVRAGKTRPGVDVAVIVGESYETARIFQILPLPLPKPSALPEECRQ